MAQISGLNFKIQEMAHRIRELREIEGYTIAEMAAKTDVTAQEYLDCETGRSDLTFAFIYRCALAFNVDVTDIIQGSSPKLQSFTVTRRGAGQRIEEAHGMVYHNMAWSFKNRIAEPLYVEATYNREADGTVVFTELITDTSQYTQAENLSLYTVGQDWPCYYDPLRLYYYADALDQLEIKQFWRTQPGDNAYLWNSTIKLTDEQSNEFATLYADIATFINERYHEFYTCERSLDEWDSYVAQIESMGIADCIAIYQEAYDTFMAKQ